MKLTTTRSTVTPEPKRRNFYPKRRRLPPPIGKARLPDGDVFILRILIIPFLPPFSNDDGTIEFYANLDRNDSVVARGARGRLFRSARLNAAEVVVRRLFKTTIR